MKTAHLILLVTLLHIMPVMALVIIVSGGEMSKAIATGGLAFSSFSLGYLHASLKNL
jgi:hypothetical protein